MKASIEKLAHAGHRVGGTCLAALLAGSLVLAARAEEPAADPNAVMPAESTVLPNAPKVGDKPTPNGAPPAAATIAPVPAGPAAPPAPGMSPAEVAGSPDWPCVQRKVPAISAAQIWDGPPIDGLKGWENDEKIQDLTVYLESRRVTSEEAEKAIKDYVAGLPAAERDQKLTLLFASLLAKVNADREFVMGKIETFQKRQKARAEEIEREGRQLAEKNQQIPAAEELGPRDAALTPEQQEYNWNARIFQERQQNLSVACEIPPLIEEHLGEVARLIRAQMQS